MAGKKVKKIENNDVCPELFSQMPRWERENNEILAACKKYNGIADYETRIIEYYKDKGTMPERWPRHGWIIDEVEYRLNLHPSNWSESKIFAQWYFCTFYETYINWEFDDLVAGYKKCSDDIEREDFLTKKLEEIKTFIANNGDGPVARGYNDTILQKEPTFKYYQDGYTYGSDVKSYMSGIALYKTTKYVRMFIEIIAENKTQPLQNEKIIEVKTRMPSLIDDSVNTVPEIKPIFRSEDINTIYNILKNYFSAEHKIQLKQILKTGGYASEHLIFLDNGKRLADAFRQLFDKGFITGCQKQELEKWIVNNFKYRHLQNFKFFSADYIEKCISRNYYPCKNPLIIIDSDVVQPFEIGGKKR